MELMNKKWMDKSAMIDLAAKNDFQCEADNRLKG